MATPKLSQEELDRRKQAIEECLREGFTPLNVSGGRGSSIEEAVNRLGLRSSGSLIKDIKRGVIAPDWSLYKAPVREASAYVIKGRSTLVDAGGATIQRWDKTRIEGRDPDKAVHLPDPKRITKLSTLTDAEGKVIQQWTAEKPEEQAREQAWLDFAQELAEKAPRAEPVPPPEAVSNQLLAGYPIGDHHMGMLSWREETGSNYDLKAGGMLLRGAMAYLTQATGAAETAMVVFMGDFFHIDNFESVTPTNRNMLDADSRLPKVGRAAAMLARSAVDAALAAHAQVHVFVIPGNHDPVSSMFLRLYLEAVYENEPRVLVETSPALFQYFRFGNCLIGMHHGHTATKLPELPLIMATDRAKDWGATSYRYVWTGHTHKDAVVDVQGCKVESFRVLPPADAWAHGRYRPAREMKGILYHKQFGESGRTVFNPHMLAAGAA